jgi:CDP-diacylglycerol--glycerol-3-phosphate 3-phosphatidyltransferase
VFDSAIVLLTALLWVTALGGYGLRVARLGSYQSQRVHDVGGTVLVGKGVMQATYWAVDPLVRRLVAIGVTANAVTWSALVFGVAAGFALAFGRFGVACLLATVSTLGDLVDGQIARVAGTGSARGAFLDSVIDRYTEFAFIAGFILHAHDEPGFVAIALLALLASFMSSYATAKAELASVRTPRGLMRRHERAVVLILGAGLTGLLGSSIQDRWPGAPGSAVFVGTLALVAVIGNVATLRRLVRISRALGRDDRHTTRGWSSHALQRTLPAGFPPASTRTRAARRIS